MSLSFVECMGFLTVAMSGVSYVFYIREIFAGKTHPHAFSWLIWALVAAVVFLAQVTEGAGTGAWVTGFTMVICSVIALLALRRGEKRITLTDWISFLGALAAIPVWQMTADPFYAVLLVVLIDALGFYPTFRKSWRRPEEETLIAYALNGFAFSLSLFALHHLNWTTALYPAFVAVANGVFVIMVMARKRAIGIK